MSFIPVENMNVERLRDAQSSINKLARSLLNEFKKVGFCVARYRQH